VQPESRPVDVQLLRDGDEAFELPGIDRGYLVGADGPEDGLRPVGHALTP
jgi:hypothetical protein